MKELKDLLDIIAEDYRLRNEKLKMQTNYDINQLEEAKRLLEHGKGLNKKQLEKLKDLLTAVIDHRTAIAIKEIDSEDTIEAAKLASEKVQKELAELRENEARHQKEMGLINNALEIGNQEPINREQAINNIFNAHAVKGAEENADVVEKGQKKIMLELLKRQLEQEKLQTKITESELKQALEMQLRFEYDKKTDTAVKKHALRAEQIKGMLNRVLAFVGINREVSRADIENEFNKTKLNNAKVGTALSEQQLYVQMKETIEAELEKTKNEEKLRMFRNFVNANEYLLNKLDKWSQEDKNEIIAKWRQSLQSMFGNEN